MKAIERVRVTAGRTVVERVVEFPHHLLALGGNDGCFNTLDCVLGRNQEVVELHSVSKNRECLGLVTECGAGLANLFIGLDVLRLRSKSRFTVP